MELMVVVIYRTGNNEYTVLNLNNNIVIGKAVDLKTAENLLYIADYTKVFSRGFRHDNDYSMWEKII